MQKIVKLKSDEEALKLFGNLDENITFVEKEFSVEVHARGHRIAVSGTADRIKKAEDFLKKLLTRIRRGERVSCDQLAEYMPEKRRRTSAPAVTNDEESVFITYKGKRIVPRSETQKKYVTFVHHHDILFAIGPAGTGKTYLAVASALAYLKQRKVGRLILTRPAIEAGESLGYLPGDMHAKINPYLRPLYDALYEMIGFDEVGRFLERGIIEIAPLAYMRGRTLNDAFIILDEAQNATPQQMKMFLTRLGFSSKAVVTGDITQIDLPRQYTSGLVDVQGVLKDIEGIQFCYFSEKDVVRHTLVKDIIKAYEKKEKRRHAQRKKGI